MEGMFKDKDFQFTINVFFQDELFEEVDEKYFSPAARFHNLQNAAEYSSPSEGWSLSNCFYK